MPDALPQFDAVLEVQPPVADKQLADVPAGRGVVLLAAEGDEPIVLLPAADMRARIRTRLAEPADDGPRRRADLRQITRKVLYRRCDSHLETDLTWLDLCEQLWPGRFASMVGWKPPWFIHIDLACPHPHFARTREVFAKSGQYFGPFPTGRDADAFIAGLQDAFDLCRSLACLRQAPNGPKCAYAEMGKCVSVADGTISMDEYRDVLRGAIRYAAGDRQPHRGTLTARMKQAAAELKFEVAAAVKTRLDRLEDLEADAFRRVAPAERFGYLLVQPGAGRRQVKVFMAWRSALGLAGVLDVPWQPEQVDAALASARWLAETDPAVGLTGRLRMGLVARTLFADPPRCGLILPWRADLSAEELKAAIEDAAEVVGLSETALAAKASGQKADAPPQKPAPPRDAKPYNGPNSG